MSNRRTHDTVGLIAGGAWAAYSAPSSPTAQFLAEVAGGAAGGLLGSRLPDWFEPAIHSHHRDVGHSVATVAFNVHLATTRPLGVADWLRAQSAEVARAREVALQEGRPVAEFLAFLGELLLRFLAGLVNGLCAGYVSHLACDATTPRSIPLIARGF